MSKNFTHQLVKRSVKLPVTAGVLAVMLLFTTTVNAVNTSVSIRIQTKNVKYYPNPAISYINFEVPQDYVNKNYSLQVFSFTGKKMYETTVSEVKFTLTFSNDFYRGIYVFQLRDASGRIIETGKFQVNK
ncbi:T9SS type A sorting domain-containing protein [Parafilimonas sp.]|uniref:T9SS type A sorting domain-containing protein n=1 Tax=Parafilimonas sp. TaxID=1969739 RepID=UPI0039E246F8